MNPIIAKGSQVASIIQQQVASKINSLRAASTSLTSPKLAILLVGESPASTSYVKRKIQVSRQVGIEPLLIKYPQEVHQEQLISKIQELNNEDSVDGILVELPLPSHLDRYTVIHSIAKEKDVDCLHSANLQSLLVKGELQEMLPCTPAGIIALLDFYDVNVASRTATVVGRSHLVGYPLSVLLMKRNATVTICHRETRELQSHIANADIVVSAAGVRHLIKGHWIKKGAVVIDVGINQAIAGDAHKIVGDVEYEEAVKRASLITPVPGGVGPMTICRLMVNLQNIWCKRNGLPIEFNRVPHNYLQD